MNSKLNINLDKSPNFQLDCYFKVLIKKIYIKFGFSYLTCLNPIYQHSQARIITSRGKIQIKLKTSKMLVKN
jgi:hypothetical protein